MTRGNVVLSWPTLIAAALQAKQPTTGLSMPMHNDPVAHTQTAQSMTLDASPFTASGTPANQSLPALHLASVQGNSGQSSYSYPLQVPPGTGGFAPHLTLTYSSAGPNERHNATSPAGDVGDGWSLNMGSISAEVYPGSPNTTWYFLNNVANVGDRLHPHLEQPLRYRAYLLPAHPADDLQQPALLPRVGQSRHLL